MRNILNDPIAIRKSWQSGCLKSFEDYTDTTPTQAAKLLGLEYPRYNEFKNGTRKLKPYHVASITAHMKMSKKDISEFKIKLEIEE